MVSLWLCCTFRPAQRVKLQAPLTAQQVDRMGLECQMLTLLSTWLLDLSTVVIQLWAMQPTASRTRAMTGILIVAAICLLAVCVYVLCV